MTGWLTDTLLYTGLLIALVLVLRRPAGRIFGPQLAYALWALPLARLLLPPVVLPAWLAPEPEPASTVGEPMTLVLAAEPAPATVPTPVPEGAWDGAALMAAAGGALLWLWLAGAVGFLLWRVAGYRRMRAELLADARPVGEVGRIRLVETPAVSAPVAFGVRDKVIALPGMFMVRPDREGRDLAIAHELEHHRGHDLLANFAAQALLALHWFNPLAWLGWRAMRRDQEAACDARVMAGRGREDRARYAELIAGIAAGVRPGFFRESLAAPMACPVLGETSIIHRLRSLTTPDIAPGRKLFGYGLIAAGVLALPLTASISYAAGAQEPEASFDAVLPAASAPPAPPEAADPPLPPEPPVPPEAPAFAARDETGEGAGSERRVQRFVLRRDGQAVDRDHFGPELEAKMEAFAEEMERFGEAMEAYGEAQGVHAEAIAEGARAQALAGAAAAQAAPEVVMSCDEGEQARTTTPDGRRRIVICQRRHMAMAMGGLRTARAAIAGNRAMSAEVRDQVLRELDAEIARIERE